MNEDLDANKRADRIIGNSDVLRSQLQSALFKLEEYANQLELEAARLRATKEEADD